MKKKIDAVVIMCTCYPYGEETLKFFSTLEYEKNIEEVRIAGGAGILHDHSNLWRESREVVLKLIENSKTINVFSASDLCCKHYKPGRLFRPISPGELKKVQEEHLAWAKNWLHDRALNVRLFVREQSEQRTRFREVRMQERLADDSFLYAGSDSEF